MCLVGSLLVVLVVVLSHPAEELRDYVTGSLGQSAGELVTVELKETERNKLEGRREGWREGVRERKGKGKIEGGREERERRQLPTPMQLMKPSSSRPLYPFLPFGSGQSTFHTLNECPNILM